MSVMRGILYAVLAILVLAMLLGAGIAFSLAMNRVAVAALPTDRHFSLVDQDGHPVTERSFPHKLVLVYFGYASCPDACPTELGYLARVVNGLGPDAERVVVAFVSVDPERDTPVILRGYVHVFGERFTALTGTPEALSAAARSFGAMYQRVQLSADPRAYAIDHTNLVYVIDDTGHEVVQVGSHLSVENSIARLRAHFPHPETP